MKAFIAGCATTRTSLKTTRARELFKLTTKQKKALKSLTKLVRWTLL
jgi:hypothetical protein